MEKRTLWALIAMVALGAVALVVMRSPEKGQRQGPPPRPIAEIKAAGITKLELWSEKQEHTVIEKAGADWRVKAPGDWKADQAGVKSLVDGLEKLSFGDTVSENADKHAELGVADGKGAHVVAYAGDKKVADLLLGKTVGGYSMVRVAGQKDVWQGSGLYPYLLNRDPKGWRDHTVFDLSANDLDKLTVESPGQKLVLTRETPAKDAKPGEPARWKIAESVGVGPKREAELDQAQVGAVVQGLATLHAADFADDKKLDDVKGKGAALAITVTSPVKGGTSHTLYVGPEKGEDVWIAASDSPQVYTVKKYTLERIGRRPIDYRDKTIIKAGDGALVAIDLSVGGDSLTLSESGGKWKAGKGEVDDAKVKPLVSAFDDLQASGFVEDRDAAAQAMAKPAGTVTLHLKDKRTVTLKVGGTTKDNADYYVEKVGSPDAYLVKKYAVDRFLKKPADLAKK